jgi:hypothetical protein
VARETQNPTTGQLPSAIWRGMISLLGAKKYPRTQADIAPIAKVIRALWSADHKCLNLVYHSMPSILNDLRRLRDHPDQFILARKLVHQLYTSPTNAMLKHQYFAEIKVELKHCVNGSGSCGQTTATVDQPGTTKSRRQVTSPIKQKSRKKEETVASN